MKRIKASIGPKDPRLGHQSPARPPPAGPTRHAPAASPAPWWLSMGLSKMFVLGAIVVGGVAVVLWLRDLGTASGVNWLH